MKLVSAPRRRAGFTLIELLVVITIIVVLISLLLAGIWYALAVTKERRAQSDISQMAAALDAFKAKYKTYPPSRVKLCANRSDYGNTQLDSDSITMLNTIWPSIGNWVGVDWSGGQYNWNTNKFVILEGDQCLVFFLGGIPMMVNGNVAPNGFAIDQHNPAGNVGGRVDPFYQFPVDRLVVAHSDGVWRSYMDPWNQQPYAYFFSGRTPNGYQADCPTLGVQPYAASLPTGANPGAPRKFYNPNTHQIITAGADGVFGPGGGTTATINASFWSPQNAMAIVQTGADDLSNFYDARLGVPK